MAASIAYRPTDEMAAWLTGRAERSATPGSLAPRVRIELGLWRVVLREELARQAWTLPEIGAVASVCNGVIVPDTVGRHLAGEVADAIFLAPGTLGDAWGISETDLVGRLMLLGPAADIALTDAVAAWWVAGLPHSVEGWAEVGVRIRGS